MNNINTAIFCGISFIIGGVAGYFFSKKHNEAKLKKEFNDRLNEELQEIRELYVYGASKSTLDKEADSSLEEEQKSTNGQENEKSLSKIEMYKRRKEANKVAYNKHFDGTSRIEEYPDEPYVFHMTEEDEKMIEEERRLIEEDETEDREVIEYEKRRLEMKTHAPELIDEDDLDQIPAMIDRVGIYYYHEEDLFVEVDTNTDIPCPGELFGTALSDSGFLTNEDDMAFIMNYQYDTLYEIEKRDGSYYGEDEE